MKERFNIAGLLFFLIFLPVSLYATHNRAGEITYKQISDLTYRITVTTYTSTGPEPVADRPSLEFQFGDGTKAEVRRIEEVYLPDYYKRNKYVIDHVYPGPGTYQIFMEDPNRNRSVKNIPNSVNVVFSIKTILIINPSIGLNNTPVLLNPPIDKAALGYTFIHNPAAFDPDGDSLSYKLAICTAEGGKEIDGYTFPPFSDSLVVNERTGDLIWAAPTEIGKYNVAMTIEEWRKGVKIGRIQRDMQIEVYESTNKPPVITGTGKFCILAGETFYTEISATDPNGDKIRLQASGGPFSLDVNPAVFQQTDSTPGYAIGKITWTTDCSLVRKQPYLMIIKAKDVNSELQLIDSKNIEVYVQSPPPKNLKAIPASSFITLSWDPCECANAAGYRIYRRTGSITYTRDICRTGMPPELGYQLVGEVNGHAATEVRDDNNGLGLVQTSKYCYRVVAFFNDGAESLVSDEICTQLVRGFPLLVKVSVSKTDENAGEMDLAWLKPPAAQLGAARGPFVYRIYRSEGLFAQNPVRIDSMMNLNDTTYTDRNINTLGVKWSYLVELWNVDPPNNVYRVGDPQMASSLFLKLDAFNKALKLSYEKNVPWVNENYTIYRVTGAQDDSLTRTTEMTWTDQELDENLTYCYRVKSIGGFPDLGIRGLVNYSQIPCAMPVDTVPPCAPILTVKSDCDGLKNQLSWNNVNDSCNSEAVSYRIYYRNSAEGDMICLDTLPADNHTWLHAPDKTMAGCYAVTAVDGKGNESARSNTVCVDDCISYSIPNVFTPNGDNHYDLLRPMQKSRVEKIDLKIFSRWNVLVFSTTDPEISWDGKNQRNGKMVPSGVYYYVCTVYERRLTGIEQRYLTGFVHVLK